MRQITILLLVILTFFGCRDEESFAESDIYHEEEVKVYNDVFNEIADTTYYYEKLSEQRAERAVFFLYRNLEAVDNSGKTDESLEEFVAVDLKERLHSIERLDNFPKYRFAQAEEEKLPNPVRFNLHDGEESMNEWLTLSRVLFNSNFTEGLLHYKVWSGNLASGGGTFRVRKVNSKWIVIDKILAPVA